MKTNDATEKNEVDLHLLAWKVFHDVTFRGVEVGAIHRAIPTVYSQLFW